MSYKAIFLLLLLLTSQAAQLRKSIQKDPIKLLEKLGENSGFSKNLVNSMLLHLKTGGLVEDLLAQLKVALIQSETDKTQLVAEFDAEVSRLDAEISGFKQDLADMRGEQSNLRVRAKTIKGDLKTIQIQIENLEQEVENLNQRERRINEARNNDILAYSNRLGRDENALKALKQIIPKLRGLAASASTSSFIQKSMIEINEDLKLIPSNSPIQALLQLSSSLSQARLNAIVEKLEIIQKAIADGKDQDKNQEDASRARFEGLSKELSILRIQKQAALNQSRGQKNTLESELVAAEAKIEQLGVNITNTETLLASTQETKETTVQHYTRRIESCQQAVDALKMALEIINGGAQNLQDREAESTTLAKNSGF